jgi:putative thioredoxin
MADSPYIFNATKADFATRVIEASKRVPVLVDFWAAWCGPCQVLLPVLTRLVDEYQGQFLLAKVNTEEEQALALEHGIRSIPTLKLYRLGKPVEQIMGAQPEAVFRAALDRYIERESDRQVARAIELARAGAGAEAVAVLRGAVESDPANRRAVAALAELLVSLDELDAAAAIVERLPDDTPGVDVPRLRARIRFGRAVEGAPELAELQRRVDATPESSEARYQLAARQVVAGQFEPALRNFLELMRRDRGYGDDVGRKGMLAVFDMLGGDHELVGRYRRAMFNALH